MIRLDDAAFLKELRKELQYDFVSCAQVIEGARPVLNWVRASGNSNRNFEQIVLESGKGVAGIVYKSGNAMVIRDADHDLTDRERVDAPILIAEQIKCLIATPIWDGPKVSGVLLLALRTPGGITKDRFDRTIRTLQERLSAELIHDARYEDSVVNQWTPQFESLPIYELTRIPAEQARYNERNKIAQELHDSVVQKVVGVQMLVRAMRYSRSPKEAEGIISRADKVLTQIEEELREKTRELRRPQSGENDLVTELTAHFHFLEDVYRVKTKFISERLREAYDDRAVTAVVRVCQEATVNACKYADVDAVEVSLADTGSALVLSVSDNGKGFDASHVEAEGGGQGLPGMAYWASEADGLLTIDTRPGNGTQIRLTIPLV